MSAHELDFCELTEEKIIGMRGRAADAENLNQVVKLAMDVADHSDWRADVDDVALPHENLLCFFAYFSQQSLSQQLLAFELVDAGI